MSTRVDQLAALGGFLDDTDYAALAACLVDYAARRVGSYTKAREIALKAIPPDRRAIVAAMLPRKHVDQLAAFGGFLNGTEYNGAALQACLREMVDALTYETRNPAEARRIILNAIPSDRRAIVAAMLPEQTRGRGRQKGSHSPKAARRAFALCERYAFYKAKHGTAKAAMEALAEIKDVDFDTIKRELPRARRLLSPYEHQLIKSVAELTAKSG